MAMRNILMRNVMGAGTYSQHAYQAFRTLKSTGEGKTPFRITDQNKLRWMCKKVGINAHQDIGAMAVQLADFWKASFIKIMTAPHNDRDLAPQSARRCGG